MRRCPNRAFAVRTGCRLCDRPLTQIDGRRAKAAHRRLAEVAPEGLGTQCGFVPFYDRCGGSDGDLSAPSALLDNGFNLACKAAERRTSLSFRCWFPSGCLQNADTQTRQALSLQGAREATIHVAERRCRLAAIRKLLLAMVIAIATTGAVDAAGTRHGTTRADSAFGQGYRPTRIGILGTGVPRADHGSGHGMGGGHGFYAPGTGVEFNDSRMHNRHTNAHDLRDLDLLHDTRPNPRGRREHGR